MTKPTPYLDPINASFAQSLSAQPPISDLPPSEFRAVFEKIQKSPHPTAVHLTHLTIADVKVTIFRSPHIPTSSPLPIIFYFHGGGWISGSPSSYHEICADLALQTGAAVIFPDYTFVPAAHFPTQHSQCYNVVKWIHSHSHLHALDATRMAVVGDSAGGQLAIATTILCSTREPKIPIAYQVLLSPSTNTVLDEHNSTQSSRDFADGPVLTLDFEKKLAHDYVPDLKDRRSALASPRWYIEPEQARRQPRTLIVSAEVDPSRDDGEGFGQVLQGFGVEVGILRMQGVVHDGLVWEAVRGGETAKVAIGAVVGGIKRAFGEVEDGKGEREVVTRKRKSEEKEEGKERKTRRQKKRGVKL